MKGRAGHTPPPRPRRPPPLRALEPVRAPNGAAVARPRAPLPSLAITPRTGSASLPGPSLRWAATHRARLAQTYGARGMHGAGGPEATKQLRCGSSKHGSSRTCVAEAVSATLRSCGRRAPPPAGAALPRLSPRGAGGAGRPRRARPRGRSAEANQNTPRPRRGGAGRPSANPRPARARPTNGHRGESRNQSLAAV